MCNVNSRGKSILTWRTRNGIATHLFVLLCDYRLIGDCDPEIEDSITVPFSMTPLSHPTIHQFVVALLCCCCRSCRRDRVAVPANRRWSALVVRWLVGVLCVPCDAVREWVLRSVVCRRTVAPAHRAAEHHRSATVARPPCALRHPLLRINFCYDPRKY